MYTDDLAYQQYGEKYKHHESSPPRRDLFAPRRTAAERYGAANEPLLSFLFSHYWVNGVEFDYFDIGCQYGSSAMAAAMIVGSAAQDTRVIAFDCGVAGNLVPYNLMLNGMQEHVTYEPLAVSYDTYPALVFGESGHSENNRIVNRAPSSEAFSYIVMATSIDAYRQKHGLLRNLIVKIDTQGGEMEVLAGAKETLQTREVTMLMEFVPGAMGSRQDPGDWLAELSQSFTIYELGDHDIFLSRSHHLPRITEAHAFTRNVSRRAVPYTDLLLIPRNLKGHDTLLEHLDAPAPR